MIIISESETRDILSVDIAGEIVHGTYRGIAEGRVTASQPSMMRISRGPFRLGAKGAVLLDLGVAGVRLTSRSAPRLMLWSLATGEPIAFLDESSAYRFRTGVSAAVAARYLLPKAPLSRVALIGAGPIAREIATAVAALLDPGEMVVASRSAASSAAFAEAAGLEGTPVMAAKSAAESVEGADLVITITSANEILVRQDELMPGATVLSMGGGLEVDHGVWAAASARFVDDLDYALLRGDAAAWIAEGRCDARSFKASLAGTIADLAAGRAEVRREGGVVMAIVQGTTALDVALGHAVYRSCTRQ